MLHHKRGSQGTKMLLLSVRTVRDITVVVTERTGGKEPQHPGKDARGPMEEVIWFLKARDVDA